MMMIMMTNDLVLGKLESIWCLETITDLKYQVILEIKGMLFPTYLFHFSGWTATIHQPKWSTTVTLCPNKPVFHQTPSGSNPSGNEWESQYTPIYCGLQHVTTQVPNMSYPSFTHPHLPLSCSHLLLLLTTAKVPLPGLLSLLGSSMGRDWWSWSLE